MQSNDQDAAGILQLSAFIGEKYRLTHLHPWYVRLRKRFTETRSHPSVLLLSTESQRHYKLYRGGDAGRHERMVSLLAACEHLSVFPSLAWSGSAATLVDYYQSRRLAFGSREFASALARQLAALHGVQAAESNAEHLMKGLTRDLAYLAQKNLLTEAMATRWLQSYESRLGRLSTGLDYSDIKPANFMLDQHGQLRFIDCGALRMGRPAGQYLCGSYYFRQLDRSVFSTAYLEAGGLAQVVHEARLLRMLHCLWLGAKYSRKARLLPGFMPLEKLVYRRLARQCLAEFTRLTTVEDDYLARI